MLCSFTFYFLICAFCKQLECRTTKHILNHPGYNNQYLNSYEAEFNLGEEVDIERTFPFEDKEGSTYMDIVNSDTQTYLTMIASKNKTLGPTNNLTPKKLNLQGTKTFKKYVNEDEDGSIHIDESSSVTKTHLPVAPSYDKRFFSTQNLIPKKLKLHFTKARQKIVTEGEDGSIDEDDGSLEIQSHSSVVTSQDKRLASTKDLIQKKLNLQATKVRKKNVTEVRNGSIDIEDLSSKAQTQITVAPSKHNILEPTKNFISNNLKLQATNVNQKYVNEYENGSIHIADMSLETQIHPNVAQSKDKTLLPTKKLISKKLILRPTKARKEYATEDEDRSMYMDDVSSDSRTHFSLAPSQDERLVPTQNFIPKKLNFHVTKARQNNVTENGNEYIDIDDASSATQSFPYVAPIQDKRLVPTKNLAPKKLKFQATKVRKKYVYKDRDGSIDREDLRSETQTKLTLAPNKDKTLEPPKNFITKKPNHQATKVSEKYVTEYENKSMHINDVSIEAHITNVAPSKDKTLLPTKKFKPKNIKFQAIKNGQEYVSEDEERSVHIDGVISEIQANPYVAPSKDKTLVQTNNFIPKKLKLQANKVRLKYVTEDNDGSIDIAHTSSETQTQLTVTPSKDKTLVPNEKFITNNLKPQAPKARHNSNAVDEDISMYMDDDVSSDTQTSKAPSMDKILVPTKNLMPKKAESHPTEASTKIKMANLKKKREDITLENKCCKVGGGGPDACVKCVDCICLLHERDFVYSDDWYSGYPNYYPVRRRGKKRQFYMLLF